jgi:hypothetical protein
MEGTHSANRVGEDHVKDDSILGQSVRALPASHCNASPLQYERS